MRLGTLWRVLGTYFVLLAFVAVGAFFVGRGRARQGTAVVSVWAKGRLVARKILPVFGNDGDIEKALLTPDAVRVDEEIVGEGFLARSAPFLGVSLVPGRDGIEVNFRGRQEMLTVDDLLAEQAYDHGVDLGEVGLTFGLDLTVLDRILVRRFGVAGTVVRQEASWKRVRFLRHVAGLVAGPTGDSLTELDVRNFVDRASRHIAEGVLPDGQVRYFFEATTDRDLPGAYSWPRHAGATYFLAEAAHLTGDEVVRAAAARSARHMVNKGQFCGGKLCIGVGKVVDLGSSALGLLALTEVVRRDIDPMLIEQVKQLADFIRGMQRADGEMKHEYDMLTGPVDVQYLYYSGEAAFALARAARVTHDSRDRDAARRVLEHLVGPGWSFFGSRYYFGEEHWTCQAMEELWLQGVEVREALDFCLRWHAYGRQLQYHAGETQYDAEGAYGFGPVVSPRYTPVASRTEAAVATLVIARRANVPKVELDAIERQIRASMALLVRHQFPSLESPGYLLVRPKRAQGGLPGSPADFQLRVDYAQHSGSGFIRWLRRDQVN